MPTTRSARKRKSAVEENGNATPSSSRNNSPLVKKEGLEDVIELKEVKHSKSSKKARGGGTEEEKKKGTGKVKHEPEVLDDDVDVSAELCEEDDCEGVEEIIDEHKPSRKNLVRKKNEDDDESSDGRFVGEPFPDSEARKRWPGRYKKKSGSRNLKSLLPNKGGEGDEELQAVHHYYKAEVDGTIFNLHDDVYVKAEDGMPNYIGRIVEFFKASDQRLYFIAQWFYRAEDTVIRRFSDSHDPRRVFLSDEKNNNLLDCILSKIKIVQIDETKKSIANCDFYYDMHYSLPYTSFSNLVSEKKQVASGSSSTISSEIVAEVSKEEAHSDLKSTLLDLYSGCGAMSTGLCQGASLSGLKLETRWAVDLNPYACSSLKLNHPNAQVRNEKAEDFLALLKEWEKLCARFYQSGDGGSCKEEESNGGDADDESGEESDREFEVEKFLEICYGDPTNSGTIGLKLKVRWKGYSASADSWEPIDNLWGCEERLQDFVKWGRESNILPLPVGFALFRFLVPYTNPFHRFAKGGVDVICGGPPCQGISGFNRFRNFKAPLEDPKNQQVIVFMDIVEFLKPRYVLMENVVDILKFASGHLGRYAISRLIQMNFQSRLGIMAAGCYGLPQFRLRAFLWGASPKDILPPFPLPTHNVIVRGGVPNEFERNLVAYDEDQPRALKEALVLGDAISDLPPVGNDESRDEMPYNQPPITKFQEYIRSPNSALHAEMLDSSSKVKKACQEGRLFDHRPLKLNADDYERVKRIPKKKGANFRDLPGVRIREDNVAELDPTMDRVYLTSNKPLVPDYAISFVRGKSLKPFGRLWWDETVPTVVTRAEPHNQIILHPNQDRVLSIRENARLQGFPDHYKLCGPIKERYIQVGNAVAVPVARALGYALGQAYQGLCSTENLMTLPEFFP